MANTIPNAKYDRNGTTAYHTKDDSKNDSSHPNAAAIMMMMRTGSLATVNANMTNGAPKARREQLKNSARVILADSLRFQHSKPNLYQLIAAHCRHWINLTQLTK